MSAERRPQLHIEIVESSAMPGLLSVRVGGSASALRRALVRAGFKAGDRAVLTLAPSAEPSP